MRALRAPIVTAMLIGVAASLACGLESQGLLVTDGGVNVMGESSEVAEAAPAPSDDDAREAPPPADDGGTSSGGSDGASPPREDASTPVPPDSGPEKDAAPDAPFTCASCVVQMCPTQLAACGQGSDCLAVRDCEEACSGSTSSTCSKSCTTMYPAGAAAFAALTICDLGCGAGCAAGLATGTP